MPPIRPMLDNLELELAQAIEVDGHQVQFEHGIPALEGNFLQRVGRRGARIKLSGMITGVLATEGDEPKVSEKLKDLREKFKSAKPLPFTADIATATRLDQVLIEEMLVREIAGLPERFEYAFTLREYTPASEGGEEEAVHDIEAADDVDEAAAADAKEQHEAQTEQLNENVGVLNVQVEIEGEDQDFTGVVVIVEGTTEAGDAVSFSLTEQTNGLYVRENVPAGTYTVTVTIG